ncbi:hypothetical protein DITRI_Ditri20bG0032600 [Diplodiscus trichospermus]
MLRKFLKLVVAQTYRKTSKSVVFIIKFCFDISHIALDFPINICRPDHNLQDVRAKIFPFKRRKSRAPEVMRSSSAPAKRKERSLSSLVVCTPKVPMQTGLTGKRTKATARKRVAAFQGCSFSVEEPLKKEDFAEDYPSGASSPHSLSKISQRQDSSMIKPSSERRSHEDRDNVEILEGKEDLWTPLNCLVEAANRKSSKLNSQGSATSKAEPHNGPDHHSYMPKTKAGPGCPTVPDGKLCIPKTENNEHGQNSEVQDEENKINLVTRPVKRRRLRAAAQKKAAAEQQAASARVMLDALGAKWNRKNSPIWFSLVASEDQ